MERKDMIKREIFEKGVIERMMKENPFVSVGDVVWKTLEEAILTSRLPAGTRLNITKISKALNVSATPVRNAIDRLVEDQLIKVLSGEDGQHKNYVVFDISAKELEDLFTARKSIEGMAAYICADKPWTLDLQRMQVLANIFYEGLKKYASQDIAQRAVTNDNNVDREFHKMIVNATGNQYMIAAYRAIEKKVLYLSIRTVGFNAGEPKNRLIKMGSQHVSIYNAIRDGYPDLARTLMEEHIDYCMNSCLRNHNNIPR